MAAMGNTYSRFITLAKLLLPLAALAILSTIFLVSRNVDPTASIPYAKVDVEQLIRDQGISSPTYSTMSNDGTAITFSAARVLPTDEDENGALAEKIQLHMDYSGGAQVNVSSDHARLDSQNDQAMLQGDVLISTSDGYEMRTQSLLADMEGAWLRADTTVQMTGPTGNLTAGQMEIRQSKTDEGHHVVDFHGGVKLIYTPQSEEDAQ